MIEYITLEISKAEQEYIDMLKYMESKFPDIFNVYKIDKKHFNNQLKNNK